MAEKRKQSPGHAESVKKYHAEKTVVYNIRLVRTTEADILAKLDSVENRSRYIKDLIRQDIKNS